MNMKKKNSLLLILIGGAGLTIALGLRNKRKMEEIKRIDRLTLSNYVNRLKEFDLSSDGESINFFYDLIEIGFHPNSAFELTKKECMENGESLND